MVDKNLAYFHANEKDPVKMMMHEREKERVVVPESNVPWAALTMSMDDCSILVAGGKADCMGTDRHMWWWELVGVQF